MMKLLLLSGGLDSGVALATQDIGYALFVHYGSKHNEREFSHAKLLCAQYSVPLMKISLPFINDMFKSDLLKSGGDIPYGYYEDEDMKRTIVPFRNGIMLSIAAGLAESMQVGKIVISAHAGDHTIYPDCRDVFIQYMRSAVRSGTSTSVSLETPFINYRKEDIVVLGAMHDFDFNLTWSCYKGGELHCGECGTCSERKEAFDRAGVKDNTIYG